MSKRGVAILAVAGVVLFVAGLLGWIAYRQARDLALSEDSGNLADAPGLGPGCNDLVALVMLDQRVMTESETQALEITLRLPADDACTVGVSLLAPNFTTTPAETTRLVTIPAGGEVDVAWIISPQEIGTFELVIIVDERSETVGITVTNTLGFTAAQVQILSLIGTFLGPILTAPWWYDRWKERQKEKKEEAARKKAEEAAADEAVAKEAAAKEAAAKKVAAEKEARPGGRTIPFE